MQTPVGHLTYCTNIHSGESWSEHFAQLKQHIPVVKKTLSPQAPMGIGLRLSNAASLELAAKETLNIFKDWLQQNDCYVFTINGFPYGGFHGTVVKEAVHTPDWLSSDRVDYTVRLAQILAQLLPDGLDGGISTSPLSYRYWFDDNEAQNAAIAKATENILAVVVQLVQLEKETGKRIHIDIEPEPDGLLETGAEFLDWYKNILLPAGVAYFNQHLNMSPSTAEEMIKRHITLCYDVCHFAIGYEEGTTYLQQLDREGIKVGKLQISAALKSTLPANEAARQKVFETFSHFNEPVYLHQVVARETGGNLLRYRDLPQALADAKAKSAAEWRAHFHVPLFAAAYGVLQSTQKEITDLLQLQCAQPFTQHLEVETYTWEVLPPDLKLPLTDSIIRELQWLQQQLPKGKTNILLAMQKTVVIDIVGLSRSLIGDHTPFLKGYTESRHISAIRPMLPAVTTAVQSTYVTGKWPSEHGIVGNGWYDAVDSEIKFWKQSNKLVGAPKIWDKAKAIDSSFTCSKMFWWYNMYSSADYSATPRPNYLADGRKMPDCYTHPAGLRDYLQKELGTFPLFQFWGPGANIKSSQWIADASVLTDIKYDPTLTLIYLPHLDYCLQKFGPDFSKIATDLQQIDAVVEGLIKHYESKGARIILLSEYGITNVSNPIHINRVLRQHNLIAIREGRGLELLDAGASKAFAVSDHQIAHVYVNDPSVKDKVKSILEGIPSVELVLDKEAQKQYGINHPRSGDFVVMGDEKSWFTYYFWMDDAKAPDYARAVDIHKKPGYDPVEMFMSSKGRAAYKLLRKKLGFRYVMDVIPLDATLVKGSHGRLEKDSTYHPILITNTAQPESIQATDVYDVIWQHLNDE